MSTASHGQIFGRIETIISWNRRPDRRFRARISKPALQERVCGRLGVARRRAL